jgi:hypothetical protein
MIPANHTELGHGNSTTQFLRDASSPVGVMITIQRL